MRMLRPFFSLAAVAMLAVAAFVVRMFAALKPEPFNFTGANRLALAVPGGDQITASAFHGLRHESSVHRRSAERHI